MAEQEVVDSESEPSPARGRRGVLGVGLASLVLGAGAFGAIWTGLLDGIAGAGAGSPEDGAAAPAAEPSPAFLELEPIVVSVGPAGKGHQLRFRAWLQVSTDGAGTAERLRPRILDVFTTYLRAVPMDELAEPTALLRLRAQLLRRVQTLVGPDAVEDLLIADFLLT